MRGIDHLKPAQAKASGVPAVNASAEASTRIEIEADADEVLPESEVGVEVVYQRWIIGLVDHFAAIRVLERVSAKLPPEGKINFSILGLNRPSLSHATSSWDTLAKEIQLESLCQDNFLFFQGIQREVPTFRLRQ